METPTPTPAIDFKELVQTHYQALYRFARSLTHQADDASDLVQQTFLVWAEKGHHLRDTTKAKSWLFTTLYREFLRQYRRGQRLQSHEPELLEAISPPVSAEVVRRLEGKDALAALQQLDENYRAPLALYFLEDLTYQEIAETLDIPIGTVMSRLSRGKNQLKSILTEKNTQ